jgi:undecaprenyl-diphosphatase
MLSFLQQLDKEIFLFLNGIHNPFFDSLMWYISLPGTWIPFYVLLSYLLYRKFGKNVVFYLVIIGLAVGLSDFIASGIIKESVQRFRPSREHSLDGLVHLLSNPVTGQLYMGGKYGFVSSHAANSFALAVLFSLFFDRKWASIGLIFWALLVSYSRIYLGVHYPGDILGGALVGVIVAFLLYKISPFIQQKINTILKK